MKRVLTALFSALLSLSVFAGDIDLPQTGNDIKLIQAHMKPSASNSTLRRVDVLTRSTVGDLGRQLSQYEPDSEAHGEALALWNKLEQALINKTIDVEQILSEDDYEQQAAIREQVDEKAMTINRFYQQEIRTNPSLGGRIVVELHFLPTGYLADIDIKSADEGMKVLARRILPLLRTVRIKPQETAQAIDYKLIFFPHEP